MDEGLLGAIEHAMSGDDPVLALLALAVLVSLVAAMTMFTVWVVAGLGVAATAALLLLAFHRTEVCP